MLLDRDEQFREVFPASFHEFNMISGIMHGVGPGGIEARLKRADILIVDPLASFPHMRTIYSQSQPSPMKALAATLFAIRRINPYVRLLLLFPYLHATMLLQHLPFLRMLQYGVLKAGESTRMFTNMEFLHFPSQQEAG